MVVEVTSDEGPTLGHTETVSPTVGMFLLPFPVARPNPPPLDLDLTATWNPNVFRYLHIICENEISDGSS